MAGRILIVGAGHAGGTVAALLRQGGHADPIALVGEEPAPPYQRPPLSKAYLKGEATEESLFLRPESFYADQNVALIKRARAVEIDRANKRVAFDGASTQSYDTLILATGSRPRALPFAGADAANVRALRTLADAKAIGAALQPGKRLVVVGGGYIGLEVAASARAFGAEVTIVEREARCLARVASPQLSDLYQTYHRARGVEIITGAAVEALESDRPGVVSAVRLQDGRRLPCDLLLVGVGAVPCDELTRAAGLACDGGVVVDLQARTEDSDVHAIGDMTRRPLPIYEDRMGRLESVPNALEQAKQAAAAILGKPAPAAETPWFWSDQYDLKLQIAGLPLDCDEVVERRGDNNALAVYHLRDGVIRCVEAVNSPGDFVLGKRLIAARAQIAPALLADVSVPLKQALSPVTH